MCLSQTIHGIDEKRISSPLDSPVPYAWRGGVSSVTLRQIWSGRGGEPLAYVFQETAGMGSTDIFYFHADRHERKFTAIGRRVREGFSFYLVNASKYHLIPKLRYDSITEDGWIARDVSLEQL